VGVRRGRRRRRSFPRGMARFGLFEADRVLCSFLSFVHGGRGYGGVMDLARFLDAGLWDVHRFEGAMFWWGNLSK
jgi:hypothetical protein